MNPGIYLVHKPVGQTSFSLVRSLMEEVRAAGIRRDRLPICHGGALDPFAEGLLLLLAGEATRLMELLHAVPKTYVAEIAWGAETDNGDPLGRVVARGDAGDLTPEQLEQALAAFIGWRDQVPPRTSNKRVAGERAYRKAHRGESFELPPSRVYLHGARWLGHRLPASSTLELVSGGGYYVRSLPPSVGPPSGHGRIRRPASASSSAAWISFPGAPRSASTPGRSPPSAAEGRSPSARSSPPPGHCQPAIRTPAAHSAASTITPSSLCCANAEPS